MPLYPKKYICYEDDLDEDDEDDLNLALIILFRCVDICTAGPCAIDRLMKSELLQYLNHMRCSLGYSNPLLSEHLDIQTVEMIALLEYFVQYRCSIRVFGQGSVYK